AIYEVGTLDDQVFIAMEFVKGMTLTKWMALHPVASTSNSDKRRSWKETLDMFMQAGRGLAAAHRAGIIHRDFKPDNVLLGRDGRVRVVDFGLARAESSENNSGSRMIERPDTFADAIKMASRSILGLRITRTGGMTGTPAYMAPEQYTKRKIDTRTDQFSFCVALYEGLYGERPFKGETVSEVRKQVVGGLVDEEPPGTDVPQWLRRVVLRGLSVLPGERYPSIDSLLGDLSSDTDVSRQQSRRRVLVAVGVVAVLGVAGLGYNRALTAGYERAQAEKLDQCTSASRLLAGIWDEERKEVIRGKFLASGVNYAADTWQRVERLLDRYTEQWASLRNESCAATHIEHTQSQQEYDQESACFDKQLNGLRALSELFASEGASSRVIDRAVFAARTLPSVS
ncbi:MAG: serine/threonine protein kinase, partial [Nannocystaceae bacterium]